VLKKSQNFKILKKVKLATREYNFHKFVVVNRFYILATQCQ